MHSLLMWVMAVGAVAWQRLRRRSLREVGRCCRQLPSMGVLRIKSVCHYVHAARMCALVKSRWSLLVIFSKCHCTGNLSRWHAKLLCKAKHTARSPV